MPGPDILYETVSGSLRRSFRQALDVALAMNCASEIRTSSPQLGTYALTMGHTTRMET
jgi:hypothetical protein